ncbi:MAG: DUF86 domain-containing protein [Melioribacter sp.]|uniref:type VII toxin-antitoxin system HepT family RNase toxin n=1 Tax=Rosettibacter primus TaxID=3111523 RepID=UPI00247E6636|nr:DUF86 domain-containing protein [Melioribacter sp.]
MIIDKLKTLEENLKILNKIKNTYKPDDFLKDKVDEWGLRYGIFENIQIIIDIASSIVAEKNLGTPKNYSEAVTLFVSNNYIENELGRKLIKMIGLRNLLVHEYGIIDIKKLYEYLNSLEDIRDFVNTIKEIVA